MCGPRLRAVVFDTDGVLTDSARVHAAAWKLAFDGCLDVLPAADREQCRPFDQVEEYRRLVDGKSRFDGALAFLTARGIHLPTGDPQDPPGCGSVWAIAARKDQEFVTALRERPPEAFPDVLPLLRTLREAGVLCAAASASRHARDVLTAAGIVGLCETVVDGVEAARLGLPGKPDPALFVEAARRLGMPPAAAAVVEDASVGVEAARRGGFGLVVGLDRGASPAAAADLRAHGADLVVGDLSGLPEDIARRNRP
ncbi:hypothetical protein GCM10020367_60770 [Streptomyces sannanensis]|uniref:HAD family hydrolase n=1 Tax=Streptomyces sannanensis TaxID=285536 RepID=A0ABP6SLT3_9ACTN